MSEETRTAVITGATSGIGQAAASALAQTGWRLLIAARDAQRAQATVSQIREQTGSDLVESFAMDLTSFDSVRQGAAAVSELAPRIDVLINNAGLSLTERQLTGDGLETMMQTNHFSHFLLTSLLLPNLLTSDDARVVNVSSRVYERAGAMPLDDLNFEQRWGGIWPYCVTKQANILFTNELHRRTHELGLAAYSVHPGVVATRFQRNFPVPLRAALGLIRPLLRTPKRGAEPVVELATVDARRADAGAYFDRHARTQLNEYASDRQAAERLWDVSNEITGAEWPDA